MPTSLCSAIYRVSFNYFLYVLATSKVIFKVRSRWLLTCDSVHSWRLYSAAPLGNQAFSTMMWYPTQSHLSWHFANQSLCVPNYAEHLAKKRQALIFISHWFDSIMGLNPRSPSRDTHALSIRTSCPGTLSGKVVASINSVEAFFNADLDPLPKSGDHVHNLLQRNIGPTHWTISASLFFTIYLPI